MKNKFPIFMFIALQLASFAVLTMWVVWSARDRTHVMWLIQGILLMIPVIGGATIIFIYWTKARALDTERVNFISSVSHELLTPLSSVQLYIDTMQMRELTYDQRINFLTRMTKDTERLSILIGRILAASKAESHKTRYNFEICNLCCVIEEFIEDNKEILEKAELKTNLEKECWGRIDKDTFNVLMENILQNAIKYSREKARITIDLKKVHNKLLITFSDQGEGIDPKNIKAIFSLFFRASRKRGGTGLGLYIVKSIVRDHKGKVWAESGGLGKGTSLKILLPSLVEQP